VAEIEGLFPPNYEASRERFRAYLADIDRRWSEARLEAHPLSGHPELSIDWIWADANQATDKLLVFTTAEHGVEGYVGSAMLEFFRGKYLPRLDPETTGLLLVHAICPWGMAHRRRTNAENVDLNRNFVWDAGLLEPAFNPRYPQLEGFLGPAGKVGPLWLEQLGFLAKYLAQLIRVGKDEFWTGKILGQYAYPKGIHYGGTEIQEEVRVLKGLYRRAFEASGEILHLDMHTGYGPRDQMTIVNSPLEPRSSTEFIQELDYPLVAAMTADEFYEVRGDMVDFVYTLRDREFPQKVLYSTAFEFGTFGESHWEKVRSLQAMVFENRLTWHGAVNSRIEESVLREFLESFSPSEERWRRKAIADADQALEAILRMTGFG
jgi:Protein of unknown function (DUF2817)